MREARRALRPGRRAVLAALLLAGCARSGNVADDAGRAVAARFLDELRAGRIEPAWNETSAEFKSLMGFENLRDYVRTHPALKAPAAYASARPLNRDGLHLAEYVFHATPPPSARGQPAAATIKVLLAAGADGWKVEHLTVE
jgi:hypothetical protein